MEIQISEKKVGNESKISAGKEIKFSLSTFARNSEKIVLLFSESEFFFRQQEQIIQKFERFSFYNGR